MVVVPLRRVTEDIWIVIWCTAILTRKENDTPALFQDSLTALVSQLDSPKPIKFLSFWTIFANPGVMRRYYPNYHCNCEHDWDNHWEHTNYCPFGTSTPIDLVDKSPSTKISKNSKEPAVCGRSSKPGLGPSTWLLRCAISGCTKLTRSWNKILIMLEITVRCSKGTGTGRMRLETYFCYGTS